MNDKSVLKSTWAAAFTVASVWFGTHVGGGFARLVAREGDIIDKVVDMQRVAAGEHAGNIRHQRLVDYRAFRCGVEPDSEHLRHFVLGQKSDGEDERVAGNDSRGGFYRLHLFVYLADLDRFNALDAENFCDRGREVERDIEIFELPGK